MSNKHANKVTTPPSEANVWYTAAKLSSAALWMPTGAASFSRGVAPGATLKGKFAAAAFGFKACEAIIDLRTSYAKRSPMFSKISIQRNKNNSKPVLPKPLSPKKKQ
jgi:hypothetical protein